MRMKTSEEVRTPGTALLAAGALVAIGLVGGSSQMAQAEPLDSCRLGQGELTFDAQVAPELTQKFADYGNSGEGWTGGDSTYSITMDDGRRTWLFSDTFLGPVDADGGRPLTTPFINNSFIIENGNQLSTVVGGTSDAPEALIPPLDENGWFWIGAGALDSASNIQLVALKFWYGGGGMWDFGWESNQLAVFDSQTYERVGMHPLPSESGVQWASWIEQAQDFTYIYGIEDAGENKYMHVARVPGLDLTGTWEFWDGSAWSDSELDTVRIMDGLANEYSVTPLEDGYLVITQDTHELFSRNIVAYVGCSPTGPFERVGTVYEMPEVGELGTYGSPNVFTYNAHEHPDLRTGNSTIITYNVNSFDSDDLYDDVTIYRPRFVSVDFNFTGPSAEPTPIPTDPTTEPAEPTESGEPTTDEPTSHEPSTVPTEDDADDPLEPETTVTASNQAPSGQTSDAAVGGPLPGPNAPMPPTGVSGLWAAGGIASALLAAGVLLYTRYRKAFEAA